MIMENEKELTTQEKIDKIEAEIRAERGGKKRLLLAGYLVNECGYNQTAAAIKAGYTESKATSATASEILARPNMKELINLYQKRATEQLFISPERVIKEYASMAFGNIQDFIEQITEKADGEHTGEIRWKDLTKIPREMAACIKSVKISSFKGGKGGRAEEKKVEITFHDKISALDKLSVMSGFVDGGHEETDRVVINISGEMGGLLTDNLPDEEEQE